VPALRGFTLVDRETTVDEREVSITTETVRLHRLVRQVAAAQREGDSRENAQRALIDVATAVNSPGLFLDPKELPQARTLDALSPVLVGGDAGPPTAGNELPSC
jgi:hypothetical protein